MSKSLVSLPPSFAMGVSKGPGSHGQVTGDTLTCCNCGMPSSKEWAQRVHTRTQSPGRPFYPFLAESKTRSPPTGARICEKDGTTFLCAFCFTSLEAQWNSMEKGNVPLKDRHYNANNFICAVCGVETYRKRVRALPFHVNNN